MQSQKHVRSSGIFLIELILAIFFFSLASAVCVQIFVKSHLLSRDAQQLNFAVGECSSVAEYIIATDAISFETLYYDAEFQSCGQAEATYKLSVTFTDLSETLSPDVDTFSTYEAQITFAQIGSDTSVYSLNVTHHIAKEVQP